MGIEGDGDHREAAGVRDLARAAYDVLVPEVDTVEVANDDG